jgi:hypothetical protein
MKWPQVRRSRRSRRGRRIEFERASSLREAVARNMSASDVDALGVAVMMGGGPATMYACDAFAALEQFESERK